MPDVYVAAGSNLQPGLRLREALALLKSEFGALRVSPAYRNAAFGFEGEDFVNLGLGFTTGLSPQQVVERLQSVEVRCGRPRDAPKWAARAMDLDIVLYGNLVCKEPGLILPRPDLVRRAYMLKPMVDIAPDVVHPTLGRSLAEIWADHDDGHELKPVELDEL
jgi:2-amino-4-hydroxy-6-hydroxymethyldihydropteridine diphosphokinase